jgi:hypothetical protein
MSYTIRDSAIRELVALLKAYAWTAVTSPDVYRGRQVFDPDTEPPPLITVLPRIEESFRNDYGMFENSMPVDLICLAAIGVQNPSELGEAILGEMILAVYGKEGTDAGGDPEKSGGMTNTYVDDVLYRSGGIDAYPDDIGQQILHVGITVVFKYTTNAGDPFSNT